MELVQPPAPQERVRLSARRDPVEVYAAGHAAAGLEPGDFILTHANHTVSRLIRVSQNLRMRGPDQVFTHWSHAAIVVASDGTLVEAETKGVRHSPLDKYRDVEYHLVRMRTASPAGREAAAAFANSKVGEPFGFADMGRIALSLLTGLQLDFGRDAHQICSGLVASALEEAGEHFERPASDILPADLAKAYDVRPPVV